MGRVDSESRFVYCLRQVEPSQPEAGQISPAAVAVSQSAAWASVISGT
ncbi:hypothetical protein QF034_008128 [Streptomyces africanus]|uniref:Uncharacterized protein n=1 Tax=Streptomyces africanus TaxID=231024 RepID=A0ABU0R5J1_9ACTN|nr:hypothetical protein [Streptomyces africanus]MDQ0753897.1 hypothetical protein [Streptomyces africanus]